MASWGQIWGGERFEGEEERAFGRREHSGGERVKKSKKKRVFGYKDSGIWNSKPGIAGLSFSGGVKTLFHTVMWKNHFPREKVTYYLGKWFFHTTMWNRIFTPSLKDKPVISGLLFQFPLLL